jgi:hypothetical protein
MGSLITLCNAMASPDIATVADLASWMLPQGSSVWSAIRDELVGGLVGLSLGAIAYPVREWRLRSQRREEARTKLKAWLVEVHPTRDDLFRAAAHHGFDDQGEVPLAELPAFPSHELSGVLKVVDPRVAYYALDVDSALRGLKWVLREDQLDPRRLRVASETLGTAAGKLERSLEHPLKKGQPWQPPSEWQDDVGDEKQSPGAAPGDA